MAAAQAKIFVSKVLSQPCVSLGSPLVSRLADLKYGRRKGAPRRTVEQFPAQRLTVERT